MLRLPRKNVAIKPFSQPSMSDGGIIIPEMAKGRMNQGLVKYVAEGCEYLKPGDHVLFGLYDGTLIFIEGEGRLLIMSEEVVPCVIEGMGNILVSGLIIIERGEETYDDEARSYSQPGPVTISEAIELIHAAIEEQKPYSQVKAIDLAGIPKVQERKY